MRAWRLPDRSMALRDVLGLTSQPLPGSRLTLTDLVGAGDVGPEPGELVSDALLSFLPLPLGLSGMLESGAGPSVCPLSTT